METEASIVIPVYNEEDCLRKNIPILIDFIQGRLKKFELIIVENGSRDKSGLEAENLSERFKNINVLRLPKPCLGLALEEGFLASSFDNLIYFPIDLSVDLWFIIDSLKLLRHYDIVLGSKRVIPGLDDRHFLRRCASKIYHYLVRKFLGLRVTDSTCVKAYRKRVINDLVDVVPSVSKIYETEILVEAANRGYKIVEIPVRVVENRKSREALMFKIYSKTRDLLSIRLDRIALYFGLILLLTGLVSIGFIVLNNIFSLNYWFINQYFLFASMIMTIIGFQTISLGLLANLVLQIRKELQRYRS